MVVCDKKRRICYLNVGWPASMHDQRVWKNSFINCNLQLYFSPGENLVGDSAFSSTYFAVPAYKIFPGEHCNDIPAEHFCFNTLLAALHVHGEHTNDIWKGRFLWLHHISIIVSNRASMLGLMKYVKVTAILHNLFVRHEPPKDWILPEDRDEHF